MAECQCWNHLVKASGVGEATGAGASAESPGVGVDDGAVPADGIGTREALNGCRYSQAQFQQYYGDEWESFWDARAHTNVALFSDAPVAAAAQFLCAQCQLPAAQCQCQFHVAAAVQLPPLAAQVRLGPTDVVAVRNAEAARGAPRSLHNIARRAHNSIVQNAAYHEEVNLDGRFPWIQYVAAHAESEKIIGTGITHAAAVFVADPRVCYGGIPRLDFFFYRTDGSACRVHPGNKRSCDAKLIFEST